MFYLLTIPAAACAYYYFKNNKNKIGNKFVDLYATLAVMTKETLKKTINHDFILLNCDLIYNEENSIIKRINVTNYFYEHSEEIKKNRINKDLFNKLIKVFNIDCNQHNNIRLLFNYKFDNIEYYKYSSYEKYFNLKKNNTKIEIQDFYPFYNKEIEKKFIENDITNYFNNESSDSKNLYILLNSDLKDIQSINEEENINEKEFIEIFNKLKGPFNDYGYITNNLIKSKWIFEDFKFTKSLKINIKQGLYLDEEDFDLKSDEMNIEYNDNYIILPSLEKLFNKKINLEGLSK